MVTRSPERSIARIKQVSPTPDLRASILAAWRTSNRITIEFVEQLPPELMSAVVPGIQTRPIRAIAAHLHNSRCWWIKMLGAEHGIAVPLRVDHRTVNRRQLVAALKRSGMGIEAVLQFAIAAGGTLPRTKAYVWRNLPLDVGHIMSYFIAHEGHHRGQIVMAARQMNRRLPSAVTNGLWWWAGRRVLRA